MQMLLLLWSYLCLSGKVSLLMVAVVSCGALKS